MRTLLLFLVASAGLAQEITAEKLIETGHWKRARTLVEDVLRRAPDDPNANFLSSQIHNAFGDHTSPEGLAEKAVRLSPSVGRYHRQLAEVQGVMAQHAGIFQQLGLARRFRKEIDTALRLDPKDTQALRDLLEFYLLAPGVVGGGVKKAESVGQQIAALDAVEGFLARARVAEFHEDRAEMGRLLQHALEVRPASYKALTAMAHFYLSPENRTDAKAEELARAARALDSSRTDAYSILASIYAHRGDWASLDAALATSAKNVPDDFAPYYFAADELLAGHRELSRAEKYLRLYLSQEPEGNQPSSADAHWKLGTALRQQGSELSAIEEWKLAVQLDRNSPAARELQRTRNASTVSPSHTTRSGGAN